MPPTSHASMAITESGGHAPCREAPALFDPLFSRFLGDVL